MGSAWWWVALAAVTWRESGDNRGDFFHNASSRQWYALFVTSKASGNSGGGARTLKEKASTRLGQTVRSKWTLESLLGVGGMAAVYAATHRNGSRAALKILHKEFAREQNVRERFLREGYVANKVDHPGRVAILDDDETDSGEPYLVMELLVGETLQQLWKRKKRKLGVVEALSISRDVLDTLVPFHALNIIHRDLKPANIFITAEGVVKLLDFGVAQLREEGGEALTRAGTALGTPSYMSPEQAMGKSDTLDGRSDVFALGATLYAVLGGRRLHHGKSDNEAFILAATTPASSLARVAPDLPVEVIAHVDKALQWDRRKRYAGAAEMRDAAQELIDRCGAPGGRAPEPPPPPPGPSEAELTPLSNEITGLSGHDESGGYTPLAELTPLSAHTPLSAPSAISGSSATATGPHAPLAGLTPVAFQSPAAIPRAQSMTQQGVAPASALGGVAPTARPAPPRASQAPPAARKQPREITKLIEICGRIEKLIPALRQYGPDHPETTKRIRPVYQAIIEGLRTDPDKMVWTVHPFCFTHGGTSVWEPAAPADLVPYNLSSSGLEEVRFSPGVTDEEVRAFCKAMLIDPAESAMDDDIIGAMWEARFKHIHCQIREDFADVDAQEQERFFAEADDLEAMAREDLAEVAAMAVSTDDEAFRRATGGSAALQLDPAAKAGLGAQLSLAPERWRERYFDVLVDAFHDATERQDAHVVVGPLEALARDWARRGRYAHLFSVHALLLDRLAAPGAAPMITAAMFGSGLLRELVQVAAGVRPAPTDQALTQDQQQMLGEGLTRVLGALEGQLLDERLAVANELADGPYANMLIASIEQAVVGHEAELIPKLEGLRTEHAQRLLAAVTATRSPQAVELLRPLLTSSNAALRCEATALLSQSPQHLSNELVRLLDSHDAKLREAALSTLTRHQVKAAGPSMVRLVESETFMRRPLAEQQRIFEALWLMNAARAESLLIQVIEQHGIMADERMDQTRTVAANVIGAYGTSEQAMIALDNAGRRRPWNTPPLRIAAGAAAEAVASRLGRGLSPQEVEP